MLREVVAAARLWVLNSKAGVQIERPAYLSASSRFELHPDGFEAGGTITIAAGARISHGVILAPYGGSITIGRNVYLGPYTVLYGHGGLSIGHDVMIASHATVIPANHGFSSLTQLIRDQPSTALGITIFDNVWIGTGASVLDGVSVGAGSVIGAGAVVAKSIPADSIALGVPAQVVRIRTSRDGTHVVSGRRAQEAEE